MKINSRTIGDIHLLDCSGKISLGEGTRIVQTTIRDILTCGGKRIVLNLANVSFIDMRGVGELVGAYNTVARSGGQLKLLGLTKKIREVLSIMKLLTIFPAYDSEPAIVASFDGLTGQVNRGCGARNKSK